MVPYAWLLIGISFWNIFSGQLARLDLGLGVILALKLPYFLVYKSRFEATILPLNFYLYLYIISILQLNCGQRGGTATWRAQCRPPATTGTQHSARDNKGGECWAGGCWAGGASTSNQPGCHQSSAKVEEWGAAPQPGLTEGIWPEPRSWLSQRSQVHSCPGEEAVGGTAFCVGMWSWQHLCQCLASSTASGTGHGMPTVAPPAAHLQQPMQQCRKGHGHPWHDAQGSGTASQGHAGAGT